MASFKNHFDSNGLSFLDNKQNLKDMYLGKGLGYSVHEFVCKDYKHVTNKFDNICKYTEGLFAMAYKAYYSKNCSDYKGSPRDSETSLYPKLNVTESFCIDGGKERLTIEEVNDFDPAILAGEVAVDSSGELEAV